MTDIREGAVVQFKGGLGRNDDRNTIHTGVVNGEPYTIQDNGGAYVPVHVQRLNHNLVVNAKNIVRVIR